MGELLVGKKVLIVDDEADLREPIAEELEFHGCAVFQAGNGRDALKLLERERIDVIISDVRMPGGDGIELLKSVKSINYAMPMVMLITGFTDLSREDAYHLGAESILSKPFDLDTLIASVSRILTPREIRWKSTPPSASPKRNIEQKHSKLAAAIAEERLGMGRGGMFLKSLERPPPENSLISFQIRFEEGDVLVLEGSGTVRWVRHEQVDNLPPGFGVEFEALSDATREKVLALSESLQLTPYIPREAFPR